MKNSKVPGLRRTAFESTVNTLIHRATSPGDLDAALNGLRRMVGEDTEEFFKAHLGPKKIEMEAPAPAAPSFQAPSVLRKKTEELQARNEELEADIALYKQGRHPVVKRLVEKAVKAKTASLNGRMDAITGERNRLRQQLESVARRLHRALEGQDKPCPVPEHCPICRKSEVSGETDATTQEDVVAPETENRSEAPRKSGRMYRIWTWERYQFLAEQKLRLGLDGKNSKYFSKGHLDVLAAMCSKRFQHNLSYNAIIGALDRLARNPHLAEPPADDNPKSLTRS